jgi:hypothetical protein
MDCGPVADGERGLREQPVVLVSPGEAGWKVMTEQNQEPHRGILLTLPGGGKILPRQHSFSSRHRIGVKTNEN